MFLFGAGGHGRVVAHVCAQLNMPVEAILDDNADHGEIFGTPVRRFQPSIVSEINDLVVAVGDNKARKKIAQRFQSRFVNVVHHPSVILPMDAKLGVGMMILQGVILQNTCSIGDHVILNTGAQVDHDCVVGDFTHIGPGCVLCGTVTVGEGAFIGAGSVVIPGIRIGEWSVIGAGSVVVKDIPPYSLAMGNPARVVKTLPR